MSNAIISQVSKNLLFRYRLPCQRVDPAPQGLFQLPESHRLPQLNEFEGQKTFADVRVGWNEHGLFVSAVVTGKKQSIWCRETQLLDSDGLQIWIDTRDTHNVHRASKFCHWMLLCPLGSGGGKKEPMVNMMKINRSSGDPPTISRPKVDIKTKINKDGYQLSAFIDANCLHGWNTADHRNLGFNYAVVDDELGWQTLALGPELPILEDPSLWQTLTLVD